MVGAIQRVLQDDMKRAGVMNTFLRRLLHFLRRSRHDADLREEIETHRALGRPRSSVTASRPTTRRGRANGPWGT